jgi:hypothetical protein
MAYTEYTDSDGVPWRVWETRPRSPQTLSAEWAEGWLTFESPSQKLRLAPVPAGWQAFSPDRLDRLRRLAHPVTRGTRSDAALDRDNQPPP